MNLNDIRVATRAQLDVDDEELPNALIDLYARDGYNRMIGLETRWPFFEVRWQVTATDGEFPIPIDAREVDSVVTANGRLERIDALHVEREFPTNPTGSPVFWNQLGPLINLYPAPAGDTPVTLRGYRAPRDWVSEGAAAEVDADARLHLPIIWYCCAVAYAQQEDEVLEQTYMNRFSESVALAQTSVMRAWTGEPKIYNGYRFPAYQPTRPAIEFVVPPSTP